MLTRKNHLAHSMILVGLLLILSLVWSPATLAQDHGAYVRQVRAIVTDDFGLPNPAGLAFSPAANSFLAVEARTAAQPEVTDSTIVMITLFEDLAGSTRVAAAVANPDVVETIRNQVQK